MGVAGVFGSKRVNWSIVAVCLFSSLMLTAAPAEAQPLTSGSWSTEFSAPGFDGLVLELVEIPDGGMIAHGSFRSVDGVPAAGLAVWDGQAWSAHPGADSHSISYGLVFSGEGVLHAKTRTGIQRWTQSGWETISGSGGMGAPVFDGDSNLYAVHTLTIGEGASTVVFRKQVNVLNGENWQPLGEPVDSPGGFDRVAFDIDVGPNGAIRLATAEGVQQWDGANWGELIGGGFPVALESLQEFAVAADGSIVATGWSAVGEFRFLTLFWNGLEWQTFESGSYIAVLTSDLNNEFYALRDDLVVGLTDEGWEHLHPHSYYELSRDLISYQGALVTAGSTTSSVEGSWLGGVARLSTATNSWIGLHKQSGGKGLAGLVLAGAAQDEKLVVGGTELATFDGLTGSVMTWDGSAWSVTKTDGWVTHLTVTSDGKLLSFGSDGLRLQSDDSWNPIGADLNVQSMSADNSGGAVVLNTDGLGFTWDGLSTWTELPSPTGRPVKIVVMNDDSLVVVGSMNEGPVARLVNGSWQSLGLADGYVTEAAVSPDGGLYVLGKFDLPDGTHVDGIAFWDGAAWKPLRRDPYGVLGFDGCGVVVIGNHKSGTVDRWDGADWQQLGNMSNRPRGLSLPRFVVSIGPDIYVGAQVLSVDGQQSVGIVRWTSPSHGFRDEAGALEEFIASCDYDLATHPGVLRLYRAFFAREPDLGGAQYWTDVFDGGASLSEITEWFTMSQEFTNDYEGTTDEAYLEAVYLNVLGREYDQGGFDYWLDLLSSGQLSRGGVVRWIAANPEFVDQYPYGQA